MEHKTIMEHLRLQADRFRKQGRLQEDEMEAIIKEMREEMVGKEGGDQDSNTARAEEHKRVMEAVKEGLLQTHGSAPNSKQAGIFRVLCKNANGFNNRISKKPENSKGIRLQGRLRCRLPISHKSNVNDFKQMFQQEIACTAIALHIVHEWQQAGRVQEGGTGAICFG